LLYSVAHVLVKIRKYNPYLQNALLTTFYYSFTTLLTTQEGGSCSWGKEESWPLSE